MKIVFVNGCFDVLHPGHIALFQYAKSLGDYLIVAIDSDEKVALDKGFDRPIFSMEDRRFVLESIECIDIVHTFNSRSGLENLLECIKPDILVVGSDWKNGIVVGREHAKEVKFFERQGDYSTSRTIQGISYR
jgi:D-beta-D-heptose 7-phosphate kinase/D-beta-D-heptose 1-phosphate adenosyltransferase